MPPVSADTRSTTNCGFSGPSERCSYRYGKRRFQPSRTASHAPVSPGPSDATSARQQATSSSSTSRTSPTIGTSTARFLPISAGSMSACTTLAWGANVRSSPVTRSSNRAPSATSRSASCNAATAA